MSEEIPLPIVEAEAPRPEALEGDLRARLKGAAEKVRWATAQLIGLRDALAKEEKSIREGRIAELALESCEFLGRLNAELEIP